MGKFQSHILGHVSVMRPEPHVHVFNLIKTKMGQLKKCEAPENIALQIYWIIFVIVWTQRNEKLNIMTLTV